MDSVLLSRPKTYSPNHRSVEFRALAVRVNGSGAPLYLAISLEFLDQTVGGVGGGLVMSEVQPLITTTLSNPLGIYIYITYLYI